MRQSYELHVVGVIAQRDEVEGDGARQGVAVYGGRVRERGGHVLLACPAYGHVVRRRSLRVRVCRVVVQHEGVPEAEGVVVLPFLAVVGEHVAGLFHGESIVGSGQGGDVIRHGEVDVVHGRAFQGFVQAAVAGRELAGNVDVVAVVAPDLVSVVGVGVLHQDAVVPGIGLRFAVLRVVALHDDAHGVGQGVFGLEHVLLGAALDGVYVIGYGGTHGVGRQGDVVAVIGVGHPVEPARGGVVGGDGAEGVGVAHVETEGLEVVVALPLLELHAGLVAHQLDVVVVAFRAPHDAVEGFGQGLARDSLRILLGAAFLYHARLHASPVDHDGGRGGESGHHLLLALAQVVGVAEGVGALVGHDVYGVGIVGHVGLETSAQDVSALRGSFGEDGRYGGDEEVVRVEAVEADALHAFGVGVYGTGLYGGHAGDAHVGGEADIAFGHGAVGPGG